MQLVRNASTYKSSQLPVLVDLGAFSASGEGSRQIRPNHAGEVHVLLEDLEVTVFVVVMVGGAVIEGLRLAEDGPEVSPEVAVVVRS